MEYTNITAYCDRCKQDSQFSIRRKRGRTLPYSKYCDECKEELYYEEMERRSKEDEYEAERQGYLDDNSIESAFGDYSGDIYNSMYD